MPNNHKKRNVAIVSIIAIVVLILAFLGYQFYFLAKPAPAHIDYWIDTSVSRFYPNMSNAITVRCANRGDRNGSFYLLLSFANASFSNKTEQPYILVSSTLVKLPFLLRERGTPMDSNNKSVFFLIDEIAKGFAFYLSLEAYGENPVETGAFPFNYLWYKWNETSKGYDLKEARGGVP